MYTRDGFSLNKINGISVKAVAWVLSVSSLLVSASALAEPSPFDYDTAVNGEKKVKDKNAGNQAVSQDFGGAVDPNAPPARSPFETYSLPEKKPGANTNAQQQQGAQQQAQQQVDETQVPTDVIRYQYVERATVGQIKPQVILNPIFNFGRTTVKITRNDGKVITKVFNSLRAGSKYTILLDQPKGIYSYKLLLQASIPNKELVQRAFTFTVAYGDPVKVELRTNDLDLGNRQMTVHANRPMRSVEVSFIGDDGQVFYTQTTDVSTQGNAITFTWPEPSKQVNYLRVKVIDNDGFYAQAEINPFWLQIPHQEVEFDNGQSTWLPKEEAKLVSTLNDIQTAMQHSGRNKEDFQLYIAGYTDTVGTPEDNLKLSKDRATSIAKWFLAHNIGIPVFVQGFGESVLTRSTPDNTPDPANRRAIYLLGTGKPPKSKAFPKTDWEEVKK